MNFEDKLKKLEEISQSMRDENLSLEVSINAFEEGMKLAKELEKELVNYEKKIQILTEKNGIDQLEDFK